MSCLWRIHLSVFTSTFAMSESNNIFDDHSVFLIRRYPGKFTASSNSSKNFLPPPTSWSFTKTLQVVLKNTGQELSLTCWTKTEGEHWTIRVACKWIIWTVLLCNVTLTLWNLMSSNRDMSIVGNDLKKTGSSNLLFTSAKIWSQVILIAAILVRSPYVPQVWICSLKIMNLKHKNS